LRTCSERTHDPLSSIRDGVPPLQGLVVGRSGITQGEGANVTNLKRLKRERDEAYAKCADLDENLRQAEAELKAAEETYRAAGGKD
jgi:hypothetical protein